MEHLQAEAIVEAMLRPDIKVQEEIRLKHIAEAQRLATRRKVAWFVLAGAVLGAVTALLTGHRFSEGVIWGGMPGAVVGWLWAIWARRHAASS